MWQAIAAVIDEKLLPARALTALQGFVVLINELDSGTDELTLAGSGRTRDPGVGADRLPRKGKG